MITTISYDELSEEVQSIIDNDSDEQRIWYIDVQGHPHGIEKRLEDLFHVQDGPDPDWKLVEFGIEE